ncbi:MAG: DUF1499 domain-containing protein [Methylomicrobium sp.]
MLCLALFIKNAQASNAPGLVDGHLKPCPGSPNCVNSEQGAIEPITFEKQDAQKAWDSIQRAIELEGGIMQTVADGYLWAIFKTPMLRFTDDVEVRLDADARLIHLRSASRVGYYDLGTNRRRLEAIKQRYQRLISSDKH